jgi:lipopolysaccharide export system permease protein
MVMLMGNLMKISDMVIRKGVNIVDAIEIFSLFIPYLLGFTIPLSFLLSVLLSVGRLVADNEITAIRVAGISLFKILNVFLILGVAFSLFLFILNDQVIPSFHYRYRSKIKNIYSKNISALIEPGVFLENFQNYVLYVADKNENKLKNIFIYEIDKENKMNKLTFAKQGEFIVDDKTLKIKLEDGFRDETAAESAELYRLNFKVFFMDIPVEEKETVTVNKKASDMKLSELRRKISDLKKVSSVPPDLLGEFHKRISFSFSVIAFIILGFGVSLKVKHREKSINFGIAFLSAGIYYLLFILGETLFEYHFLAPSLAMWIPNIIVTLIGAWFLRNAHFG